MGKNMYYARDNFLFSCIFAAFFFIICKRLSALIMFIFGVSSLLLDEDELLDDFEDELLPVKNDEATSDASTIITLLVCLFS